MAAKVIQIVLFAVENTEIYVPFVVEMVELSALDLELSNSMDPQITPTPSPTPVLQLTTERPAYCVLQLPTER